ncbi:MAG: DUF4824 family protein [Pseudomonadota bacterium]
MTWLSSSRGLFLLGVIILAATNIIVLTGVASNRSGEPESQITLTERELPLPYRLKKENSGLSLRLNWRVLGMEEDYNRYSGWTSPLWLDSEKLTALGFAIDAKTRAASRKRPISKEVFIVLEYDGASYREAVERAEKSFESVADLLKQKDGDKAVADQFERAENRLKKERESESRLFAIDAGLNPQILREKYEDRTRFVIVRGLVEPDYSYDKARKTLLGHISRLSVGNIFVPLDFRKTFETIAGGNTSRRENPDASRYEVTLAYGSRLEPWIVAVRPLNAK